MSHLTLEALFGRLNDKSRNSLEAAAGLCMARTNHNIEMEHWLLKLLDTDHTDIHILLKHYGVDESRLAADLTSEIDSFKTGNARTPGISPNVFDWAREAWLLGSIEFGDRAIRTGHLLAALLTNDALARQAIHVSDELNKIAGDKLIRELPTLVATSSEADTPTEKGKSPAAPTRGKAGGKTPSLDQYTINLTERARAGEIDPVLGRDAEIRQIIDILSRRRQNNPILTGEAGVGKTAVVEGFALRLAAGDVPPPLRNVAVHTLDLGLLQAGAGVKGEFENRLKSVIQEVKSSPSPIILFIDEAHTMIGAGGQAGQTDAANLLKPALARGELRTIAATTWAEYKKYFERDAALARRFQVVKIEEPDEKSAVEMMRGLVATLEDHHRVRILNDAVEDAVRLSKRYISGRQLPDKSVSLLDTTCARIQLSQTATPPSIEDCRRRIEQQKVMMGILQREAQTGADNARQIEELQQQLSDTEAELEALNQRWTAEKDLVRQIHDLHRQLQGRAEEGDGSTEAAASPPDAKTPAPKEEGAPPLSEEQRAALRQQLVEKEGELRTLQGESPLVHPCVDAQAIAETVAAWTGIPVGRMVSNEVKTVLSLRQLLEESIVGQSHALEAISQRIRTSRAQLSDPRTPIGVFLLAGTSGVGKTETAIALANLLYGGEQNMTVINMSEFKEEHKVSLLMGSPPGYVGYGEGGVLTEAVRRKPYSVILLDEMEKAHPGVQDIFYQVFDKGRMKDGEGRDIDFKNTVIIMTTNAGTDLIKDLCADPETWPEPEGFMQALFPELLKTFKPAFLGRLLVVPYYPLNDEVMRMIIRLKLGKVVSRVADHYRATLTYTDALVDTIASRCTEVDTGARNVDHILTGTLLPELSSEFLGRIAEGQSIDAVEVSVDAGGQFTYVIR